MKTLNTITTLKAALAGLACGVAACVEKVNALSSANKECSSSETKMLGFGTFGTLAMPAAYQFQNSKDSHSARNISNNSWFNQPINGYEDRGKPGR